MSIYKKYSIYLVPINISYLIINAICNANKVIYLILLQHYVSHVQLDVELVN